MKPQATDAGRLTRRRFLSAGLLAGSLALGGGLLFWPRSVPPGVDGEARRWHFLSPANAQAVIALAPALLGPTASADLIASPAKRYALADGVDQAICLLTPGIRDELRQLFNLLASPGGRLLMLGQIADWPAASESALQSGLDAWCGARLDLVKSAYDGLRDLVFAVWYGDPANQDCLPGFGWPELHS